MDEERTIDRMHEWARAGSVVYCRKCMAGAEDDQTSCPLRRNRPVPEPEVYDQGNLGSSSCMAVAAAVVAIQRANPDQTFKSSHLLEYYRTREVQDAQDE